MDASEVILTPKIAATVLEHLSPGSLPDDNMQDPLKAKQRRECQNTLTQLATVCRAVSGAALDALWRSIDDFRYILFALKPYDAGKRIFTDDLTEADWSRFQKYALRVRELRVGDVKQIHATVWVILARWCPRGPLLPQLEHLTGFEIDTLSVCYTTLLSPSIKSLKLKVSHPVEDSAVRMTIQTAQPVLRSILHLDIVDQSASLGDKDEAVPYWALTQLHTLRVAHETTLTIPILQSLASFLHLRTLQLHIKKIPEISGAVIGAGFSDLRELTLSGRLGDICAFIVATTPPALESFTINVPRLCDPEQSRDEPHKQSARGTVRSLQPIYAKLPPSLRHFHATLKCTCSSTYHFPSSSELLEPLRVCSGLRSVAFVLEESKFHLADASLAALEDAWPYLIELEVTTQPKPKPKPKPQVTSGYAHSAASDSELGTVIILPEVIYPPRYRNAPPEPEKPRNIHDHPTIKTLAAFAQAHPHLTRLVLPSIDLDALPVLASVPLLNHGLRELRVCTLESGAALFPYACALDMLFPRLDLEDAALGDVASGSDRSSELRLLLLALQAGRVGAYRARPEAADADPDAKVDGPSAIQLIPQGRHKPPPPAVPGPQAVYNTSDSMLVEIVRRSRSPIPRRYRSRSPFSYRSRSR